MHNYKGTANPCLQSIKRAQIIEHGVGSLINSLDNAPSQPEMKCYVRLPVHGSLNGTMYRLQWSLRDRKMISL